jgi:hypothetical protein
MYDSIISLGYGYAPCYQIRRCFPMQKEHFFNKIVTPFPALIAMLSDGLTTTLFKREYFEFVFINKSTYVHQRNLEIYFWSDFQHKNNFSDYDTVREAYQDLENKFNATIETGKILFVRHHITKDEGTVLYKTLKTYYPDCQFKLLAVNERSPSEHWSIPNIINGYVTPSKVWQGDDNAWDIVLKNI